MSKELNNAPVEQAGGDERAAFEAWLNEVTYEENTDRGVFMVQRHQTLSVEDERIAWRAWQGRALLARSEQEEAERPEVVARVVHSNPVVLEQCAPLNANDEMMTFAQHAASVAHWAEMFNRVEQERDAALAEVAGLRSLLNSLLCYVERDINRMRSDRDKSDNKEIYDRSISLAMERLKAAQNAVFTTEPGCDTAVELAAQTTQAQHSVPEEFSFEYRHPNGECHTVTVSREQVINEMPDFLFEALCSKFCNCEPVGETNVVECCCDEYAEEFKLIAAAPGKEGA